MDLCNVETWNALYFIILLFITTNAVAKTFSGHAKDEKLYLYTLTSPQSIILSKILYHWISLCVYSFVAYFIYNWVFPIDMKYPGYFLGVLLFGNLGLSALFTFMSSLASETSNQSVLIAILSFPLVIPMILILINLSMQTVTGIQGDFFTNCIILLGLDLLSILLAYLLFPYLWAD